MRVGLHQVDLSWEDCDANLSKLESYVTQAKGQGCDLCLLPEMFPCGFSMRSREMARACASVKDRMQSLAQTHKIWIGGSFPAAQDLGHPTNTFGMAGPNDTYASYDKLHPFSLANEQDHFQAGTGRCIVNIQGLRCALFVCYDLRFANAFWDLAPQVDAYLVVANWPAKRRFAWKRLLCARAIENQAYVVGCNRVGQGQGLHYSGDSCVLDPLGKPITQARGQSTMLTADLDPKVVAKLRAKQAFLQDRRRLQDLPITRT